MPDVVVTVTFTATETLFLSLTVTIHALLDWPTIVSAGVIAWHLQPYTLPCIATRFGEGPGVCTRCLHNAPCDLCRVDSAAAIDVDRGNSGKTLSSAAVDRVADAEWLERFGCAAVAGGTRPFRHSSLRARLGPSKNEIPCANRGTNRAVPAVAFEKSIPDRK